MSTFPEEVQENITLYHEVNYGGIVGILWPKFDSGPGKHAHYDRCVLKKSPDGTFMTYNFFYGTRLRLL